MKLYLVRHGAALIAAVDSERPLSPEGQKQVQHLGAYLLVKEVKNLTIYHSGYTRAQQTAEIIAAYLPMTTVQKIANLTPPDSIEYVLTQLAHWQEDTMLVGHLPYLADLLHALIGDTQFILFQPATVVCLEYTKDHWVFKWTELC